MRKIRSVIVGCAHMHVNEVALYIHEQPESELYGIADIPPVVPEQTDKRYTRAWNLDHIVAEYGTKAYDSYRTMLDELKPDVAYLLCENAQKAAAAEEIARRGVDVIIEKPMAVDADGAARIVALQKKYGVNIFVNWPVAWRKYVHEMKAALDSGLCGKLQKLRYLNGHTGPLGKGAKHRGVVENADEMTDRERSRIWWYRNACGGGAWLDILCYGCYFARWMFGSVPLDVMATGANLNTAYGDVDDNIAAIMRYADGFAVAEGTWTTPRRRMPTGPEAVCSDGVIWCDGIPDGNAFVSACDLYGNDVAVPHLDERPAFRNMPWQYAVFRKEGKRMHETLTPEFNAEVVAMIDAARRSRESRRAETVCYENIDQ